MIVLYKQTIHHCIILRKFSKQDHFIMRRKIPESTLPKLNRSQLITPEGLQKLREEHDHLWRVERPDVTAKVSWAASLGDRSENAEYHYNKKRLREIDNRLRYLKASIRCFLMSESTLLQPCASCVHE